MLEMKLTVVQRSLKIYEKKLKKGDGVKTNNVNFKYMPKKMK